MSWTDNLQEVLGVKPVAVNRDANLFLRYVHLEDRFSTLSAFEEALQGKTPYEVTYRWIRPDNNQIRWIHCRASLVQVEDQEYFEGCLLDLSSQLHSLSSEQSSPDFIQTLVDGLPLSVITLDKDLRIVRVQQGLERSAFTFGDAQFARHKLASGHLFSDCFFNPDRKEHYQNLCLKILDGTLTRHVERHTLQSLSYELELLPIMSQEQICGILVCVRDVSSQVALEQRLALLERSDSVNQLAIGLVHNINNVLQSVLGQALAIRENSGSAELINNSSNAIIELTSKASRLTTQLFELQNNGEQAKSPVDLNLAAMAAVNKIEDVFASGLKISVAFGNPPIIMAERPVLERLLEHLLRTIFESSKGQRNVTITTFQVALEKDQIPGLPKGSYAKLSLSDSLPESSEKSLTLKTVSPSDPLHELFQPCKNLLAEIGGHFELKRHQDSGLQISLYFLVAENALNSMPRPELVTQGADKPNVMIIDDDLMVLDTVQRLLSNAGYNCLAAEDSQKALSLLRAHKDSIKVILLDALMPGMNGARLLRKLREVKADFQVIGFSGAPPEITRSLLEGGAVRILRKPVDPMTLKAAVAELLENKQAA